MYRTAQVSIPSVYTLSKHMLGTGYVHVMFWVVVNYQCEDQSYQSC